MNATVQSALDNLETNLHTLIDSVSSYNPSAAAAQTVLVADDELNESLEQLDAHQQSYRKILSLRETTAHLDQQLTDLLTSLAKTREQLLSVPSTEFPPSNDVPYDSLLSYASKISKFTRPPNPAEFRKQPMTIALIGGAAPASSQQLTQDSGDSQQRKPRNLLSDEEMTALDPSSSMPFTPWPSEDLMKQGRLSGVVPPDELEQAEVKEEEAAVNGEAKKEEVYNRRVSTAAPVQASVQQKPALALSLDLYDPDEFDED